MECPVCNVRLQMSDRQGIEIDYCPQCRGIWLDRGELDKIIERSQADFRTYDHRSEVHDDHRYHEQHMDYDHRYKKHKKKSFLEEVFDFD